MSTITAVTISCQRMIVRTGLFLIQGIFGAYQKTDLYGVILWVLKVTFR